MKNSIQADFSAIGRALARPWLWALLALTVVGLGATWQVRQGYTVDVGGPADGPFVRNFHTPIFDSRTGASYRWTDAYSYVTLPGIGGGAPYSVTLHLNPGRANVPVTILVNGETLLQRNLSAGWQSIALAV